MNAVIEALERVSLYYREGSSDKVYQAANELPRSRADGVSSQIAVLEKR